MEGRSIVTAPLDEWQALPHGGLIEVGDDMLTISGEISMPGRQEKLKLEELQG